MRQRVASVHKDHDRRKSPNNFHSDFAQRRCTCSSRTARSLFLKHCRQGELVGGTSRVRAQAGWVKMVYRMRNEQNAMREQKWPCSAQTPRGPSGGSCKPLYALIDGGQPAAVLPRLPSCLGVGKSSGTTRVHLPLPEAPPAAPKDPATFGIYAVDQRISDLTCGKKAVLSLAL